MNRITSWSGCRSSYITSIIRYSRPLSSKLTVDLMRRRRDDAEKCTDEIASEADSSIGSPTPREIRSPADYLGQAHCVSHDSRYAGPPLHLRVNGGHPSCSRTRKGVIGDLRSVAWMACHPSFFSPAAPPGMIFFVQCKERQRARDVKCDCIDTRLSLWWACRGVATWRAHHVWSGLLTQGESEMEWQNRAFVGDKETSRSLAAWVWYVS